ncbi:hypothetical protein [Lacunimicrobium album]
MMRRNTPQKTIDFSISSKQVTASASLPNAVEAEHNEISVTFCTRQSGNSSNTFRYRIKFPGRNSREFWSSMTFLFGQMVFTPFSDAPFWKLSLVGITNWL